MNKTLKTIFFVDDDLTNLTIGNSILEGFYNVVTLNSGAKLLSLIEKKIPDLILLDIDMPEMSGYEIIKYLKANKNFRDIPVVFLTVKTDSISEFKGLSLGAVDYIVKPFSPPLFLKRIEMHLLVESQKQELRKFNENLQKMVDDRTKAVIELQSAILAVMANLVEYRDVNTGGHIERTTGYLKILVNALLQNDLYKEEISSWDIELFLNSAQLHDIGKIAIDDSILRKAGVLTAQEFEKIKKHTTIGEQIIEKIKQNTTQKAFLEQAGILASSHHERWDGSGYPYGLKELEIPLQGRIMAIADVYDALISERSYKKAFSHEDAFEIIKSERGFHFDPNLVDVFIKVSDEFKQFQNRSQNFLNSDEDD